MLSDNFAQAVFRTKGVRAMHQFDNGDAHPRDHAADTLSKVPNSTPEGPSANRSAMTMDAIKRYILAHELQTGDPLPTEAELCADLGVSRSSVREAMRKLDALDIVHSRRGSGSYVGAMSLDPLVETLILRSALDAGDGYKSLAEVVDIRKALDLGIGVDLVTAMRGTRNSELRRCVAEMREHADKGESYYEQDINFHLGLLSYLDNRILSQLTSAMWLIHRTVGPTLRQAGREASLLTAAAHDAILDACEKGDLDDYYAAVELHYSPLRDLLDRPDPATSRT